MISYAQNFEDVILWRALKNISNGFYIDIGAQDPVLDSVSRSFYELGWRGVHVEPSPYYASKLRKERPDEEILQWAIGSTEGEMHFFHLPDTGLSTGVESIARSHQEAGFLVEEISTPVRTTAHLLNAYADRDIHWMKVDCEGMEPDIIEGWKSSSVRPWIVLVESVLPSTQTPSYASWDAALLALGYDYVYFDGLNRFYVSHQQPQLKAAFGPGPNCFDAFLSAPFNMALRNGERELAAQQGALMSIRDRVGKAALAAQLDDIREAMRLERDQAVAMMVLERDRALKAEKISRLLERACEKSETEARSLVEELRHTRTQLEASVANAEHWRNFSQAILGTTSWRITKPIRWLKRSIQRLSSQDALPADGESDHESHSASVTDYAYHLEPGLRAFFNKPPVGNKSPILSRAEALFTELKSSS
jgi:FkbM family methyltransferase